MVDELAKPVELRGLPLNRQEEILDITNTLLRENSLHLPPIKPVLIAKSNNIDVVFGRLPVEVREEIGAKRGSKSSRILSFCNIEKRKIFCDLDAGPKDQTFAIAFQLGHFFLHQSALSSEDNHSAEQEIQTIYTIQRITTPRPQIETESALFACYLLVPPDMLTKYAFVATETELSDLFVVSEEVIRFMIEKEGIRSAA